MTYPIETIKAIANQNNPQQAIQKIIGNKIQIYLENYSKIKKKKETKKAIRNNKRKINVHHK